MGTLKPAVVALFALMACGKGDQGRGTGGYDLILKDGWIVDGSGNPRYKGDVAVRGDRIVAVGFLDGAQARETLDVKGLIVAPGFIDMMGQSEINALIDNRVFSKITQGVTTEVTGEGGSVAPLTDQLVLDDSDAMKKWHYREDWRDLDGYFVQLAKQGTALNIATFVGATQVRLAVMGKDDRQPRRARAHGGHRGYADAAGGAGPMDRARIRPGELFQDRGDHRARQGGAAAWRHLRVSHAERGRADR